MTLHVLPARRWTAVVAVAAVAAGSLLLPASPAAAAEGAAPAPQEYRVLQDIHTDAISTFFDEGRLVLGTKADLPDIPGHTRLDPADTWFHLDDDAKTTLPAEAYPTYDFVAPQGAEFWLAPMSQNHETLWPGFSTESVPTGTFDRNETVLTLEKVDGPGEVELWTTGVFGAPNRFWSSEDPSLATYTLGAGVHAHANWAFTAAGTYDITVRADAAIAGVPQTATTTYTFIVGDLPEDVATTTTLAASPSDALVGDDVILTADVSPAGVEGFVEFRDGSTVLGHEPVVDGAASFTATDVEVGTRSYTAAYVPAVANLAEGSTSTPATVTVTDGSGVAFGIHGVAGSYRPGDILDARVVGHALAENQTYMWTWRQIGTDYDYVLHGTGGRESEGFLTLPIDASADAYEISVSVREGRATVSQSSWVPLVVRSEVAPLSGSFADGDVFLGDDILVELDRAPAEGDSAVLAYRFVDAGPWNSAAEVTERVDGDTLRLRQTYPLQEVEWAVQTVRDGIVVAQSAPLRKDIRSREVLTEGLQAVYRVGQTLRATASVDPALDGLTYTWQLSRFTGGDPLFETKVLKQGATASDRAVELPIEVEHEGWSLEFSADLPEEHPRGPLNVAWFSHPLTVSDTDPDTQLLFFESLSDHYHQGSPVNLELVADPLLADGDTVNWEWRWPGAEWTVLPGASGASHQLIAEQAMEGLEVRAGVQFAGGDETVIAEPVTVRIDDHGAAPRQAVTVTGAAERYAADATVSLSAGVTPATVLDTYQWFTKAPGEGEARPMDGATTAQYSFLAGSVASGTEVSVAVVHHDGRVAYGPSAPVSIAVDAPVAKGVRIDGLSSHYHQGSAITLRAVDTPAHDEASTYRWAVQRTDQGAHVQVGDATGTLTLTAEQALNDASVRVERLLDGAVVATSEPVVLDIDDHGAAPQQKVTLEGVAESYALGDEISIRAEVAPASVLNRWEWLVQKEGAAAPTVIAGENAAALRMTASEDLDGARAWARLTYDDGRAYVESEPVTLSVTPAAVDPDPVDPGEQPSDKPVGAPAPQTDASLDGVVSGGVSLGSATVVQGQTLRVDVGPTRGGDWVAAWLFSAPSLLNGDWTRADATGAFTVQIPADAPVGAHRMAVFDDEGEVIGWADLTVTAAVGAGADAPASAVGVGTVPSAAELPATGQEAPVWMLLLSVGLVAAGLGLWVARRRGAHAD